MPWLHHFSHQRDYLETLNKLDLLFLLNFIYCITALINTNLHCKPFAEIYAAYFDGHVHVCMLKLAALWSLQGGWGVHEELQPHQRCHFTVTVPHFDISAAHCFYKDSVNRIKLYLYTITTSWQADLPWKFVCYGLSYQERYPDSSGCQTLTLTLTISRVTRLY